MRATAVRNKTLYSRARRQFPGARSLVPSATFTTNGSSGSVSNNHHFWSEEWKALGLGAKLVDEPKFPANLFFVQLGFGVDQHGTNDATKAAIRAVRNASMS